MRLSKRTNMSFSFFKLKLLPFPCFSGFIFILISIFSCSNIHAAVFEIQNNCSYTIWAAALPGGGRELRQGQRWSVNSDPNFEDRGKIWARTNCIFDEQGTGKCKSGDCDGALYCVTGGLAPVTVAEYKFNSSNLDVLDISLVDGFNVPMEFKGTSSECINKPIKCTGDINRLCPTELRHPGGCNHPCTVFKNKQFCCFSPADCPSSTAYSKFFKDICPNVFSYPYDDDATSTFTCPGGSDYKVVFCPLA